MTVALLCLFLGGIGLLFIGFLFGISFFELSVTIPIDPGLFQILAVLTIIFGLFLILIGMVQSIGFLKRIKKLFDAILSGKSIENIDGASSKGKTPIMTGNGSGLNIIRPPMRESKATTKSKSPKTLVRKGQNGNRKIVGEKQISPKVQAPSFNSGGNQIKQDKTSTGNIPLREALQKIVKRYDDPNVSNKFSNWNETLMMSFPDLNKSYLYKINEDQGIELVEGYDEEAAVQVKLSSDIFIKMMTKQINPIKAYSSGELEVEGKMRNLLKLRKLMF
jgi:putative sterol carrier protein